MFNILAMITMYDLTTGNILSRDMGVWANANTLEQVLAILKYSGLSHEAWGIAGFKVRNNETGEIHDANLFMADNRKLCESL